MHRGIALPLVAFLTAALTMSASSADGTVAGPEYPPPGGVTLGASGNVGHAGGLTWTYDDLDLTRFKSLWWGPAGAEAVGLSFDGAIDEPGEMLSFSAPSSDLAGGLAVWEGETTAQLFEGTLIVPTRFTLSTAASLVAAGDAGLDAGIGAVRPVTGPYQITVLFEAFTDGSWKPAADAYFMLATEGENLVSSFGAGFYYVANQSPEVSVTIEPGTPREGEPFTVTSTSTDPDGEIVAWGWDLDGDQVYDDETASSVSLVAQEAGTYEIGLQVTDDNGAVTAGRIEIAVVRCDNGPVSGAVHDALEPVAGAAGQAATLHELSCSLLGDNGL